MTFPIWILVMILIKLDDGGSIFYRQERIGQDQKRFHLIKFRTMRMGAESKTGPVFARPDDSRRTRIGNFLRRWNLDELPQLINVLVGHMSMVGPRPERPHFVNKFRQTIPRYMTRHKIKSGLTGWAQVNGYRGNTSIQERTKYDLYYMENWSLLFDIEILIMTFYAFKNAY
ncbi:MAG: sugar transferase [Candidatus Omnitrophica bacterium]|nr:sugar transferase [Candidatus Omnitrophota bacterium]